MQIPDIDNLVQNVLKNLPAGISPLNEEIQDSLKEALAMALKKMDIVTRHDFDIQTAVLQKTRSKVEALEQKLQQLEQKLNT